VTIVDIAGVVAVLVLVVIPIVVTALKGKYGLVAVGLLIPPVLVDRGAPVGQTGLLLGEALLRPRQTARAGQVSSAPTKARQ